MLSRIIYLFSSMYTSEWLMISVFLISVSFYYLRVFVMVFARLKQQERQVMK